MSKGPQKSTNRVLLLGAGASAPYGAPIMRNFMARARRRYFSLLSDAPDCFLVDHFKSLLLFQGECMKTWAFRRDWDDVEEVYTQADLLRIAELPSKEEAINLCESIAWAIWDVYRNCGPSLHVPKLLELAIHRGERPVIISTNYDTAVESACEGSAVHCYYPGFPSRPTPSVLHFTDDTYTNGVRGDFWFPVIKLHGSANWFRLGDELVSVVRHKDPTGGSPVAPRSQSFDPAKFLEFVHTQRSMAGLSKIATDRISPAIIPPMLGKAALWPLIATQWREAISALTRARELWIVGYSFPITDAFMTRLLTEGLKDNDDLDGVYIVDLAPKSDWNDRIERILGAQLAAQRFRFGSIDSDRFFGSLAHSEIADWQRAL